MRALTGLKSLSCRGSAPGKGSLVDLSPLAQVVDVRSATSLVDSFVFVVEWGRTKIDVVEHVLRDAPGDTPIRLAWRDRAGSHDETRPVEALRHLVLDEVPGRRVGYVTDLRCTDANVRTLDALLHGVDTLYIESVFLDADREHAARKNHLTARQAGWIARQVGAKTVVPFHWSPRYQGREAAVADEVHAAFMSS